jgi:hypothetical protein
MSDQCAAMRFERDAMEVREDGNSLLREQKEAEVRNKELALNRASTGNESTALSAVRTPASWAIGW